MFVTYFLTLQIVPRHIAKMEEHAVRNLFPSASKFCFCFLFQYIYFKVDGIGQPSLSLLMKLCPMFQGSVFLPSEQYSCCHTALVLGSYEKDVMVQYVWGESKRQAGVVPKEAQHFWGQ